jgi:RimJ/RimL family protein N-acetyltransferase
MSPERVVVTPRLEVRPPCATDRARFIELFRDDDFMVFSGTLSEDEASRRFDHMLAVSETVPFAKRPVIERASGVIVGYTGVDYIDFEGEERLEWGYRLVPECRGRGYATEAAEALLAVARTMYSGELLALIHPTNIPSQRVCRKVGFAYWKQAYVDGDLRSLYKLLIGPSD